MSEGRDFYEVLGVDRSAAADQIKRAYRKIAVANHPDRNPDNPDAEKLFRDATQAYNVLSDSDKRSRYDRVGHEAFGGAAGGFAGDFGSVSEILEGLFGEVFSRKRGSGPRDIKYELTVPFADACQGTEVSIRYDRPAPCGHCRGTGAAPGTNTHSCTTCKGRGTVKSGRGFFGASRPCADCKGSGKLIETPCSDCDGTASRPEERELSVRIPAGVEHGSVRTVRGEGEITGSGRGDLHITVTVDEHPLFERQGADILCTVPVSYPQVVLGAQLEVPTLEGKVKMKLPPGTPSGKVFRLRGKGIVVLGGAGKGDQLVEVQVEVPERISPAQRRILEELATSLGSEALPERASFRNKLKELFD